MFNITVAILDTDFYALQALGNYLALDRRTRVTVMAESQEELFAHLMHIGEPELPDAILVDADHAGTTDELAALIARLRALDAKALILCLAQAVNPALVLAAAQNGARGYLLKGEVRLQVSWAIVYALEHDFVVTPRVLDAVPGLFAGGPLQPAVLPAPRQYPELTERVQQAIRLCVLEGMPASLAADEMGISLHTVRSYIKEGYRILETCDEIKFPVDMTAQERAFYRFTMPEGWRGGLSAKARGSRLMV